MHNRFWEIDAARGLAIVLMVIFNYSFTLAYFRVYSITDIYFFWFWFPRLVGAMFIFIAGVSFAVSYSRIRGKNKGEKIYKKYLLRGGKIFGLGLLITAATWIFVPASAIYFGILHLIGLSVILAIFFRNFTKATLWVGLLLIAIGIYLQTFTVPYTYLLWLGIVPAGFYTLDYFPLLPWSGFMLLGMYAGNRLYPKRRKFTIGKGPGGVGLFSLLGRHSLLIYILHQPVLLAVLYALGFSLF